LATEARQVAPIIEDERKWKFMIRRARLTIMAAIVLLAGAHAYAITPINANTYTFSCSSPSFSLTPVSFVAPITGTPPIVGAAGKLVFEPVTIVFPVTKEYVQLYEWMASGQTFNNCTLVQTTSVSGTTTTYTWKFMLASITGLTAIGSDASSPNYQGTYAPTGLVQVSFTYGAMQVSYK